MSIYADVKTDFVEAADGVDVRSLVLLQHFRGYLDNWGPALVDALAVSRRVSAFDNDGLGDGDPMFLPR
ncbi:hypothetical protein JCM4814A_03460 [Streptomyces phaeofaciens JCM 4814]|uniref:Uncharacterized protein n=1 Tax=Streptomyces phaeofaciens TaxID=68254 RepID=A0A918HS47_9ACTN|nr:hypothetical protein [Streptomyces phaeofaciens]GGT97615.1 hypothetical protein GCM10010226_88840 [Streptomyces phaeofaciens]